MNSDLKKELVKKNPEYKNEIYREFDKLSNHRYFETLLKKFPLDEEVHHPREDRSFYSKQEIEEAIQSIKDFNIFLDKLNFS